MHVVEIAKKTYQRTEKNLLEAKKLWNKPQTLAEKILLGHLQALQHEGQAVVLQRKKSTVELLPDRVAMQDATAQMALLQFMHAGMDEVKVPSTVHCDHLIRAHVGAKTDLQGSLLESDEVFTFLKTISARYGIGFWRPGSGIIHQVVLENYAFPGGMMIGTDSHTPNAGGLGMVAIGVGGADAVDVMVGEPFGLKWPGVIGVQLTGKLSGWSSPKDVILKLMSILTVKGGTGHIVEFFGEGCQSISCTGKATICNMGAEHGATTSVFPYDKRMADYLKITNRQAIATLADSYQHLLTADAEVLKSPEKYYDQVIHIDLTTLEPYVVGPHSPDVARPISALAAEVQEKQYAEKLSSTLIGSCTNSSYEDIGRSANVAKQALKAKVPLKTSLLVTPGSDQIQNTIERDGQMATLTAAGAQVLANACGPCIGQWKRDDIKKGDKNSILTSYNRNFRGRNDDNPETLAFIASPEIVTALAFAGTLLFNPLKDSLTTADGKRFTFQPPVADELPPLGFVEGLAGFQAPPATQEAKNIQVKVDAKSQRIQLLEPFKPWNGQDIHEALVLLKAQGKCTTDHISAAGPWLRFRGHLENISDNMFIGAVNVFGSSPGKGQQILSGEKDVALPKIARAYKALGASWVVFGDENYGEGSSREHAAMSPRYLGGRAIIVKSFARIHETNLKKQGMLPLTFKNPQDYEKVQAEDRVSILGLTAFKPEKPFTVELKHQDGSVDRFEVLQTFTSEQWRWFQAGSALNRIAALQKS